MPTNDKIILQQVLEQEHADKNRSLTKAEFFDRFVAEQELKDYDLSYDEIESGIVGGGGDGGIDAIYTFANGELVLDDFDPSTLRKNVEIEVVLIQSKTSESFGEDPIHRLKSVTENIFDLSKKIEDFTGQYNEDVRASVTLFRGAYKKLATSFPTLRFRYIYATCGDSSNVHHNVFKLANTDLKKAVSGLYSQACFEFHFHGAGDLLEMARRRPLTTHNLPVAEVISATGGYIALVGLWEFFLFVSDESKRLRKGIFEANVRDYQGATQVNEEIKNTLSSNHREDFWWLNNGVTIVASKAVQSGKTLTIEDPQIVNGLQTSREVYNCFSQIHRAANDERRIMVKIIVAEDSESRDKIIKATNSQTALPPASLRATDKVHRDIEEYLSPFGLYYDRRKNYHKNCGRPGNQIIGIPALAQAVMAIALQRPDHARARPSTLLKKDDDYVKVFSPDNPITLYLVCCRLLKKTQSALAQMQELEKTHKTNILYYVLTWVSALLTKTSKPTAEEIAAIDPEIDASEQISHSIASILTKYNELGGGDHLVKGPKFLEAIQDALKAKFPVTELEALGDLGRWKHKHVATNGLAKTANGK